MRDWAKLTRRTVLKSAPAAALVSCTRKSRRTSIKIGFVSPTTGPLAPFAEADDFVLSNLAARFREGLNKRGAVYPIDIIRKDSQSDPNRAAEVTSDLIDFHGADLVIASSTADTVNPVADQCEINGVPCITTNAPWEAYYFGRGGKPDGGFDWTYHFFWGLSDLIPVYAGMWNLTASNRKIGVLWPNDAEGNAFSDAKSGFPVALKAQGFQMVDSGRFPSGTNDYSVEISAFKSAGVEIVTGVLPPPSFATFWSQAAQQRLSPKIVTVAKALLFPSAVATLGERANGLTTEVWWSPHHPYRSGLTGQTAAEFCTAYEAASGRAWTQPIGFQHALFEVAIDVLRRTEDIDAPASIRDAIRATRYDSIVGHVIWNGAPVKNVCRTSLVGGQWSVGRYGRPELLIVYNGTNPSVPIQRPMALL